MTRLWPSVLILLVCSGMPVQADWMWRSTGGLTEPPGRAAAARGPLSQEKRLSLPPVEPPWNGLDSDAEPGPLPATVLDEAAQAKELGRAAQAYQNHEYRRAAGICNDLIKQAPTSPSGPHAQFLWAASEFRRGRLLRSYDLFEDLSDKYPASELIPYVARWELAIASRFLLGHREKFLGLKIRGTGADAQQILERMLQRYPYGQLTDRLLARLGDRYRSVEDYHQAILYYDRLLRDFARSPLARDAEFSRLECLILDTTDAHHDVSGLREAEEGLKFFAARYATDPRAATARGYLRTVHEMQAEHVFVIAEFYLVRSRWEACRRYFRRVVNEFGDTEWAARAAERLKQIRPPELVVTYEEPGQ